MKSLILMLAVISSFMSVAQSIKPNDPLAHTYSIVARDAKTGQMAVAVQSHWFSVGTAVPWGEAGVGVVATQSFVNKSFGIRGLDLLKQGKTPQQALDILLAEDDGREFRQVAILDKAGRVATHTGKSCIDYAGHANGENFSVQANMMLNDEVVPAMEKAWNEFDGLPLAERMIAVLRAAQNTGGDIRGKQSAALVVFAAEATTEPWNDKLIDLRVDDSDNPIKEIDRLLKVYRAYDYMNQGDLYVEKNDMKRAMEAYNAAMRMFPKNLEMQYWTAVTLANDKQIEKASEMLQGIYAQDKNWRELTRRLPKVGLLNVSEENLMLLLGEE
ncbi:MAG: Zn-dependent protease [Aequorivita sp.]|nr:Zn-dependent protease [Aequorivita sp.]MBF31662.1 Zn-dependent protease [Aequorivita sp.]|tara:strand:- start:110817 stop:111803 length:987 start_codon:yes stop_codon:yes gene_type:complete